MFGIKIPYCRNGDWVKDINGEVLTFPLELHAEMFAESAGWRAYQITRYDIQIEVHL